MAFLYLTRPDGPRVYINTDHIVKFAEEGMTTVHLSNGEFQVVKETASEIADMLRKKKSELK